MKDEYEHIRMATNERIAEMLRINIGYRYNLSPEDKELIDEAVRRLQIKPRVNFDNEYLNSINQ